MAVLLAICGPALAVSIDSHSQIHAVIGQPLSVSMPLGITGLNASKVQVQVTPGPDLPDEEQALAQSVQASYDEAHGTIRLTTQRRVMVPALSLHLVVTADTLVVNHDLEVLVDLPDLSAQHTARPDTDAAAHAAAPPVDSAAGIHVFAVGSTEPPPPQLKFGDGATRGTADAIDAQRPTVTPPPPPPPVDHRPRSYVVQRGDSLDRIAAQMARAWQVPAEPMSLALYEANLAAFPPLQPQQPLAGRTLQVPDDTVVKSQPEARVGAFRQWLRQPAAPWRLPLASLRTAAATPSPDYDAEAHRDFFLALLTAGAVGLLAPLTILLLRRLRPVQQIRYYAPMPIAVVQRMIPRPPLQRGLSGPNTDKLRIRRLQEILERNPWRSDIRLRLAQRLYRAGDARGFAQVVPPLRHVLSPEAWENVCVMGRELMPRDPRFSPVKL